MFNKRRLFYFWIGRRQSSVWDIQRFITDQRILRSTRINERLEISVGVQS